MPLNYEGTVKKIRLISPEPTKNEGSCLLRPTKRTKTNKIMLMSFKFLCNELTNYMYN